MAKAKFIDSAKELEQQAKQLFERIKKTHTDMGTTLQEVRRAEGKLIEKEKAAEKERIETERACLLYTSKGTYAPTFEGANEELRGMAEKRAHEIYGDPLPEVVQARLEKELNSIIGNGYATVSYTHLDVYKRQVDTLWPDFSDALYMGALRDFAQRSRRFGGLQ